MAEQYEARSIPGFNFISLSLCASQGTVLCDIILLNFLKGADQYKAKKFEEVSPDPSK